MARRLPDGSIQMDDGRILYGDSILYGDDFIEIFPLFTPAPLWPLIGGGGAAGVDGSDGAQGAQGSVGMTGGPQGFQGFQGLLGLTGNQGRQGNQGNQGAGGPSQVSVFDFSHVVGAGSTGALGFTPKFAFYSGIINEINIGPTGDRVMHATGFAIGTGALAKTAVMGVGSSDGTVTDIGGAATDTSSIAGKTGMSGTIDFNTSFGTALDVTAYGSGGITLTWSAAVSKHEGKLIVVGN